MNGRFAVLAVLALIAMAACGGRGDGPPLRASNVRAYLPLVAGNPAVVYFDLHNDSSAAITLKRISSGQFARSEWHATVLDNGVSRMRKLDTPRLAAGDTLSFREGGRHVMLIDSRAPLEAGDSVRLRIEYGTGGVLDIATTFSERAVAGAGNDGGGA